MAKEFRYRGKTEEELASLSLAEVKNIVGSRARRSLNRGLSEEQKKLLKKIEDLKSGARKKPIKTHQRNMIILPQMVGVSVNVYSGKSFERVDLTVDKVGHYLGEFVLSRREVKHSAPGIGATKSSAHVSVK